MVRFVTLPIWCKHWNGEVIAIPYLIFCYYLHCKLFCTSKLYQSYYSLWTLTCNMPVKQCTYLLIYYVHILYGCGFVCLSAKLLDTELQNLAIETTIILFYQLLYYLKIRLHIIERFYVYTSFCSFALLATVNHTITWDNVRDMYLPYNMFHAI